MELDEAFAGFALTFNKTYSNDELPARRAAFSASLAKIEELNTVEGEEIYGLTKVPPLPGFLCPSIPLITNVLTLFVVQFSDLSAEEFKAKYLGYKPTTEIDLEANPVLVVGAEEIVNASSIDWRTKGMVTPVKDQEQCGCVLVYDADTIGIRCTAS